MKTESHSSTIETGQINRPRQFWGKARVIALMLIVGAAVGSVEAGSFSSISLPELSLEELINVKVTSVSKKEQNLNDAASAIFVISNDDIRRSGATSIPEALRMVPGLDVAAVNAREWAISARGFNGVFANKLLVLVDGRAVYNPFFSGVFWDLQQTVLEDVDRIEVIRGPGATIWGANAVNGVINIMTRSARDTQGGLIYAAGGDVHQVMAGSRYGGQIGEKTFYRIFGSYEMTDAYPMANGKPSNDGWSGWHSGFRVDHYPSEETHLTWQADMTGVNFDESASEGYNVNTLGRWTRQLSERSSVEAQIYYDRVDMNESTRGHPEFDTVDISAQHSFGLGERNDLIWGLGYRFTANKLGQNVPNIQARDGKFDLHLFNVFVQDEFKLVPDKLTLTAGIKIEHNDFTGLELEPSFRAVFKPTEKQTLWAAVSRAVRTPSVNEATDLWGIIVGPPFVGPGGGLYLPTITGNGHPGSEVLLAYELGYRIQPSHHVSVDTTVFYNDYTDVIGVAFGDFKNFVPGTPIGSAEMPFLNHLTAQTYGGEASVMVSPTDNWRLTLGYSLLIAHFQGPIGVDSEGQKTGAPQHQVTLRSSYNFTKQASLDTQLRYVDEIAGVPAYVTADVRLSYRVTEKLELSLVGQNLFSDRHPELGPQPVTTTSEVPRGFYGKITWRF